MSVEKTNFKKKFLHINSKSLASKVSPIKQKIEKDYIHKCLNSMKHQHRSEPSEDRLSELTTKQIDRLIEMEKIKTLLKNNKRGVKPIHINFHE